MDFGESGDDHGCWILEFGDDRGASRTEFVPLADRRFVTVDVDLTDGQSRLPAAATSGPEETDQSRRLLSPQQFPLTDAVVRVRYRATEEQHRRVDHAALERLIADAGAHKLYGGIQWEPVREQQARAEGLDESLGPLDALALWLEAQNMNGAQGAALQALLGEWLEAEA